MGDNGKHCEPINKVKVRSKELEEWVLDGCEEFTILK